MIKIINPIQAGGAPMFGDTVLGPAFFDVYNALESILNSISVETQGVILKGCVVTPNGGNFDCSSGIVYLNGQFMDFAGFTNQPATKYIVPATPTNTAKTFFDGVSRNLLITQSATFQGSAPGSGQYISISNTSPRKMTNYISPQVQTILTSLQSQITAISIGSWTNITLINGWAAGYSTPQYRQDSFGIVYLRGAIDATSATNDIISSSLPHGSFSKTYIFVGNGITSTGGGLTPTAVLGYRIDMTSSSTNLVFPNSSGIGAPKLFSLDSVIYHTL